MYVQIKHEPSPNPNPYSNTNSNPDVYHVDMNLDAYHSQYQNDSNAP